MVKEELNNNSLVNVCYEVINSRFSYGLFGEFKLIIDTLTGYFNATKLCTSSGKRFRDFLKTEYAKKYLRYLKGLYHKEQSFEHKGGRGEISLLLRGVYVSRHLITHIACWVSPIFAFKVNEIVQSYFVKEFKERCERSHVQLIQLQNRNEALQLEKEELQYINEELQSKNRKYEKVVEDISPKIEDLGKMHIFVLVRTNGEFPLYAIRCQKRSKKTQIKRLQRKYPDLNEIFELAYDPNSFSLFNRLKEKINNITTFCNKIKLLNEYTIENFKEDVRKIAKEKI